MYRLLNKVALEEDEYIWSYYTRNLMVNAILPETSRYVGFMGYKEKIAYSKAQQFDLRRGWHVLPKALGLTGRETAELFLKAGRYPFEKYTLNDWGQIVAVLGAFRQIEPGLAYQRLFSNGIGSHFTRAVRICPECMREELADMGFFYYHREHQLDGVTVCRKHGVQLMQYSGVHAGAFSEGLKLDEIESGEDISLRLDYAKFAADILKGNLSQAQIRDTAAQMLTACDRKSELAKPLKKLTRRAVKLPVDRAEALAAFKSKGLSLISDFSEDNPVVVKCDCGHEFISSAKAVLAGFGCPVCDRGRSDMDILSDTIRFFCGEGYALDSFDGTNSIEMHDADTGEEYRVRWGWVTGCREKAAQGRKQSPPNFKAFESSLERQAIVKQCFGEDYELVRKTGKQKVEIRYIPTGEIFLRDWTNVVKGVSVSPQGNAQKQKEDMAQRQKLAKAVLGEEYEIAEWVDNLHVTFRNAFTGETFSRQ